MVKHACRCNAGTHQLAPRHKVLAALQDPNHLPRNNTRISELGSSIIAEHMVNHSQFRILPRNTLAILSQRRQWYHKNHRRSRARIVIRQLVGALGRLEAGFCCRLRLWQKTSDAPWHVGCSFSTWDTRNNYNYNYTILSAIH